MQLFEALIDRCMFSWGPGWDLLLGDDLPPGRGQVPRAGGRLGRGAALLRAPALSAGGQVV